ncbi:MAG TPA: band 7 protein, partial [Nocardioides sp.]
MAKNVSGAAAKVGGIGAKKGRGCLPKVIGGVIAAVILIVFLGYLFNFANTDANRIGLHYGGGIIEDKKFKSVIEPGSTNKLIGPGDTVYTYPIDQRSYI